MTKERHPCVNSQSQQVPSQSQLSCRGRPLQPSGSKAVRSCKMASAGSNKSIQRPAPGAIGRRARRRPAAPPSARRLAIGHKQFFVANLAGPRRFLWGLLHDRRECPSHQRPNRRHEVVARLGRGHGENIGHRSINWRRRSSSRSYATRTSAAGSCAASPTEAARRKARAIPPDRWRATSL
jgi:hypothetical protein